MTIPSGSTTALTGLKRDLLVRHLRTWAPAALQRSRRITYAHGYADLDDAQTAQAALRTLAEQPGLTRGREIVMVAVAVDPAVCAGRLATVQQESPASAALVVHTVPGGTDERLGVALKAAGATRAPLFGYLDASGAVHPPALSTVAALTAGQPAEVLLVVAASVLAGLAGGSGDRAAGDRFLGAGRWLPAGAEAPQRLRLLIGAYRSALQDAGFPLVSVVEAVADDGADGEVLVFATTSGRSLESYKEALWAAGATTGVSYRDPGVSGAGPVGAGPDQVPLRRALTDRVAATASGTVTDLRTFVLTDTPYRVADGNRVLTDMLAEGLLTRHPAHGRLGGDVVIALAEPAVVSGG